MKRLLFLQIFLLTLAACQQTPGLSPEESQAIVQEVKTMMNAYVADVKTAGLTAEFNYLDQSSNFFWVPPGYTSAISYDSVATVLEKNAPLFKSIDNAYDTLRIIPLNTELATYTARIHSNSTDTAGHVTNISLLETGLVIKRTDGWKLLNGQTAVIETAKH